MLAIAMALKANIKLPNILGIECSSSLMAVSRKSVVLPNHLATHCQWSPVHSGTIGTYLGK
jgi:hypothetical protein